MTNTEQSLRECLKELVNSTPIAYGIRNYTTSIGEMQRLYDTMDKARSILSQPPTEDVPQKGDRILQEQYNKGYSDIIYGI